jgi:hypothetical protein
MRGSEPLTGLASTRTREENAYVIWESRFKRQRKIPDFPLPPLAGNTTRSAAQCAAAGKQAGFDGTVFSHERSPYRRIHDAGKQNATPRHPIATNSVADNLMRKAKQRCLRIVAFAWIQRKAREGKTEGDGGTVLTERI